MTLTVTPQMVITAIIGISTFVVAVDKLTNAIIKWVKKMKEPEEKQNEGIAELQEDNKRIKELLDRDDKRLRVMEDGMGVLVDGMLALLGHATEGNNEAECKQARKNIFNYLVRK